MVDFGLNYKDYLGRFATALAFALVSRKVVFLHLNANRSSFFLDLLCFGDILSRHAPSNPEIRLGEIFKQNYFAFSCMPGDCDGHSCKNKYIYRANVFAILKTKTNGFTKREIRVVLKVSALTFPDEVAHLVAGSSGSWWLCRSTPGHTVLTRPVATDGIRGQCSHRNVFYPPSKLQTWLRAWWLLFRVSVMLSFSSSRDSYSGKAHCKQWLKENADGSAKIQSFHNALEYSWQHVAVCYSSTFYRSVFFATASCWH